MLHGRDPCLKRSWIHVKVCNELIERIILNVKNGGKQASSYTVNLCRNEITLADHAKVMYTVLCRFAEAKFRQNKESSKIVLKLFLKKPSTSYETPSSYESTDTKIFKKIERELAF